METPASVPAAPATPPPPAARLTVSWPRSVQIATGLLLLGGLFFIAGKAVGLAFHTGPSFLPSQRINLNFATQAELLLIPGIGEQLAERILKVRSELGLFKSFDELRGVSGIGPAKLAVLRDWVYISSESAKVGVEPHRVLAVEASPRAVAKSKKASTLTEPIDVNSASAEQLMRIPGIGPKISQRIISQRDQKPFQTVADLRRVPGIGAKTLDKIKPYVTVSP